MPCPSHRGLVAEFCLVFIGVPLVEWRYGEVLKHWIVPQLLVVAFACALVLARDPSFDRSVLSVSALKSSSAWRRIALLLVTGGFLVLGGVLCFGDAEPFDLPREQTRLWFTLLFAYPLLSSLTQELIFRVYFFHRYQPLFATPNRLIAASAAVFALAHLVLGNWLAPALTLVGGALFAWTYARTRSLLVVAIEHGLWGNWLFTVGLTKYFYGGHL